MSTRSVSQYLTKKGVFTAVTAASFAMLGGCAQFNTTAGPGKEQATVCPECKMVEVRVDSPSLSRTAPGRAAGGSTMVRQHRCPGCSGMLSTFIRKGQLQHECSICRQKPYTCPVIHR